LKYIYKYVNINRESRQ